MIRVTTDVFCDKCGNWVNVDLGAWELGRRKARRKVRKLGWTVRRQNNKIVDLCPECQC